MLERFLVEKARSLMLRADQLVRLREIVHLPKGSTLTARQWSRIGDQLGSFHWKFRQRLSKSVRSLDVDVADTRDYRRLNAQLGWLEFDLADGFTLFDTYMDLLTQRGSPELGPLLAGCDTLAEDALRRPTAKLREVERPLVHCDRGYGASILRQGVRLQGRNKSPLPLIQIPYTRLKEKYNLTSIAHEAGHEAMTRLGLDQAMPRMLSMALRRRKVPAFICRLHSGWISEIGPDFWAFCATGVAQAGGAREIFSLAPSEAFRIDADDPHPPPYLRGLFAFEWCRQCWGHGIWDGWEDEWHQLYLLTGLPDEQRKALELARGCIPWSVEFLLEFRPDGLDGMGLRDLFPSEDLEPDRLRRRLRPASEFPLDLAGLSPCGQLSAFRIAKEYAKCNLAEFDSYMTQWLTLLGNGRKEHRLECSAARKGEHHDMARG